MSSNLKTGVIGLGAMGTPMARNLHGAGYLHRIWNRTPDKAEALAPDLDVTIAADPADMARACPVIISSVSADHDLLEVIDALAPAVGPESIVVDTSTVSRDTAQAAAKKLRESGAAFLDAPVSGGVEGARKGTLAMMIGGEAKVLALITPVLEAFATHIVHMGPVGAGQATKAVNQVMAAGVNQAVSEALAFAKTLELPLDQVIEIVGSGAAGNWFLSHRGPAMAAGNFEPGFKVALHHKDLLICKAMAATFDVAMPLVEMTIIHYRRLMKAGYGEEDISALLREKLALFSKDSTRPKKP
ncbi:MAG: NAD(P)-dependent oxidoreductase [Gammaproteobacteria bacterium]